MSTENEPKMKHFIKTGEVDETVKQLSSAIEAKVKSNQPYLDDLSTALKNVYQQGREEAAYDINNLRLVSNDIPHQTLVPILKETFLKIARGPQWQ